MVIGFGIAVVALVVLGITTYRAKNGLDESAAWLDHTQAVRDRATALLAAVRDHESSTRGFALTGDDAFLESCRLAGAVISRELRLLKGLTRDNPAQQALLERLGPLVEEKLDFNDQVAAARRSDGLAAASALVATLEGAQLMEEIDAALVDITAEDDRLFERRSAVVASRERLVQTFALLLMLAAFATLAVGTTALVRTLRDRQRAMQDLESARSYAQAIVDTVREPLMIYDGDLRLVEANAAYHRTFQPFADVTVGRLLSEFSAGQAYLPRLIGLLQETLAYKGGFDGFEIAPEIPGVGPRQMLLYGRYLEGAGRPLALLVMQDVTEERRAEHLEVERRALERTNRELQEFAYVASHDLQEPLRKMRAFSERLLSKLSMSLPPDARDYLDRIARGAERMQRLIDDLLTFSRLSTRAAPFVSVDLGELCREVVSDLEPRLEESGGRIDIGVLPTIEADRTQMRQLFQNLLANALKFQKPGVPPVVKVDAVTRSGIGEPGCEITVADEGIGFDEKYLDRIFTIFQRLHGREDYEGTGLGLAICRKVVERHGGKITARSTPGAGAKFIVTLPLRPAKAREAA
jgi:signal transduction histidine kinase/CHASE3 domain sensor protein